MTVDLPIDPAVTNSGYDFSYNPTNALKYLEDVNNISNNYDNLSLSYPYTDVSVVYSNGTISQHISLVLTIWTIQKFRTKYICR